MRRRWRVMVWTAWVALVSPAWGQVADAPNDAAAPQAFAFFDQSPTAQIYGLPRAEGYTVQASGEQRLAFYVDYSSHYTEQSAPNEALLFDGETARAALIYERGFGSGWQASFALPFVDHSGGFADGFINDWHDFFGLPGDERKAAPDDRQRFSYTRNGEKRLGVDDSPSGLGDIRLGLKKRLAGLGDWGMSVAGQLKLPTGHASRLTGSGGADLSLWTTIGNNQIKASPWRVLGAAGLLYTGEGDVLADQRRQTAGFGWITLGYAFTPRLVARAQTYIHTALYNHTGIEALDGTAVQGALGFEWQVLSRSSLSFAVVEDLNTNVTPDVSFTLGVDHAF